MHATPLFNLRNPEDICMNICKLTIAYSQAPNLGYLLSCRKLHVNIKEYTDMHTGLFLAAEEHGTTDSSLNIELEPTVTNNINTEAE